MNLYCQKMILFFLTNPNVIIKFMIDKKKIGEIQIELFENIAPKTVNNFLELLPKYKGTKMHRIIPGFVIQGGDYDGNGGSSIYGKYFEDENFELLHDQAGLLSMANCGPNTNGSQFFITLDETHHLDGKHVVFGKVVSGMDIVYKISDYGTPEGKPRKTVYLSDYQIL